MMRGQKVGMRGVDVDPAVSRKLRDFPDDEGTEGARIPPPTIISR
jgi:hypothetical protein